MRKNEKKNYFKTKNYMPIKYNFIQLFLCGNYFKWKNVNYVKEKI